MKVDQNITLFVGGQPGNSLTTEGAGKKQDNRKTVFAGNLNDQGGTLQDRIEQKKKEAQKQALKIVSDVFEGDAAIDEDMESRRRNVKELVEDRKRLMQEKAGVEARSVDLEKAFEAGEISGEDYAAEKGNLSEEQKAREKELDENESQIMQDNAVVAGTRLERLKHDPMVGAQEEAADIMDAARDEIIGMIREEGRDHVDEETEKREEQAKDIKEEKEEKEAFIEEQKENRREEEKLLEEMPTEEMVTLDRMQSDVRQEVQNIIDKMKLLEEDIKGAVVDKTL